MISCIICSRKEDISQELRNNIGQTIEDEYEIIVIDNSNTKCSMFSAYNEGISRAKGDYLVFMHDDIKYVRSGWGGIKKALL